MRTGPRPAPSRPAPVPGPLGWLELTLLLMRDRSHASWMFLGDEELLRAVHARGVVAAYLPGVQVGTPDVVLLRVAVSRDGRVVVAPEGQPPRAGEEQVEEFVPSLLDELSTVAFVPPDEPVGPPWLPVEDIVDAGLTPSEESRVVYCYRGSDAIFAQAAAREMQVPLTVYRQDGWIVAAAPHGTRMVLTGPPGRLTGAYPFAAIERRGQQRVFAYAQAAKESALHVSAEWEPALWTAVPEGAHRDAVELGAWLADPPGRAGPRPAGMTEDQERVIQCWMAEREDATGFLPEMCAAFGVPDIAARLVEARPGEPDPEGGRTVSPTGGWWAAMSCAIQEQDTEPQGRLPWTVLSRAKWRRPWLSVALGAGELLVALVIGGLLISGLMAGWWWWAIAAVFCLGGLAHVTEGVMRMSYRTAGRRGQT